jgi:AcrR family transcriptional regulator
MGHPKFSQEDFLGAALAIAAEQGVAGVTVASVSERLGSPTGSFYHRFASRDVLLGSLWLRTVLDFQTGISAALDADDALGAALHTCVYRKLNLGRSGDEGRQGWRVT